MKVVADQIQIERAQKQQQLNFDQEYKTDSLNIDRARLGLQQQELYQRIIENAGIDGMLNDKDIKTIESSNEGKTLVNLGELMRSAENYSDLLGQYGTELFGSGKTLLDGAYADLQVKWKEAAKLGALTGPDLQLIFDAIKPATGFRGAFSALTGGGTSGIKSGVSSLMDRITSEATVTYDRLNSRNKKYAGSNYVKQLIQPFLRPNNDDPIGVLPRDGQLVNDPIKLFQ
jgi:hypothetical protein